MARGVRLGVVVGVRLRLLVGVGMRVRGLGVVCRCWMLGLELFWVFWDGFLWKVGLDRDLFWVWSSVAGL